MDANELIKKINSVKSGFYNRLPDYDAYAVSVDGFRGIAIDANKNTIIDEKFNNVFLKNVDMDINGSIHHFVFLFTEEEYLNSQYGFLCMDFIKEENRDIISGKPSEWFNSWKNLIGNVSTNKIVYDVIGEMKVLLELQKNNKNPIWNSIDMGTFDITCEDAAYEVKTTKSKTHNLITIHNQFQLDASTINIPLFIAYCKVEKNDAGVSIEDLYNELIDNKFDRTLLDKYLLKMNYYPGKEERYIKYSINEIRLYKVDSDFPKITKDSFKNNDFPVGVVNFQYTISLDGFAYETLIKEEKDHAEKL